ncbi:aminoglycoside phosphotransferase family protein [Georgenia alba]|uniref:Aminoglycoside phosphotransferase family protein n=1 Tax=Georgenia alba TaxID=2233858 RepID=A0ABW2Q4V7_9MICO
MARMPAAEVDVDEALVRRMLAEQHPDLAGLPLALANEGWDNLVWRLGDDLAVRMPRRAAAVELVANEQRWLPELATRVQAAVDITLPVPVRTGRPTAEYPWSWSVVPWVDGRSAATVPLESRTPAAGPLAAVVRALHVPAPADYPVNPVRGIPLTTRDPYVRDRLARGAIPRGREVAALWEELVATEAWSGPPVWLHGDLHAHNIVLGEVGDAGASLGLVAAGSDGAGSSPSARSSLGLVAVVDFGDLTAGDPATDLATAWLTFDAAGRAAFRTELTGRYDDATWCRARGWALSMTTAMLDGSDDEPVLAALGREALAQILAG